MIWEIIRELYKSSSFFFGGYYRNIKRMLSGWQILLVLLKKVLYHITDNMDDVKKM